MLSDCKVTKKNPNNLTFSGKNAKKSAFLLKNQENEHYYGKILGNFVIFL